MRIIFGLGSNLGNRELNLDNAVSYLVKELELTDLKRSKTFRNPAMLLPNSPKEWNIEFFNIAFSAEINLGKFPPEKILEIVKRIEVQLGRKQAQKWAPREIDIDILAIENLKVDLGEKLKIPHVALFERDFFVKTVAEIEPNFLKFKS